MPEIINVDKVERVTRVIVDESALERFTSEFDYTYLAFELAKEAYAYLCRAAGTVGENPQWSRDQAVIGGNMVRLSKLTNVFLDQVQQKRLESAVVQARLAFETCVNVRYLMARFSTDLIFSYLSFSLRHERKLWDTIQQNIASRGGEVLPIEDRMLHSLLKSERMSGIKLADIDLRDKSPWGREHLKKKADVVGLGEAYDGVFGGLSHMIHGSWEDVTRNHLIYDGEGGFSPDFGWTRPKPQIVLALSAINLEAVPEFWAFIMKDRLPTDWINWIDDLQERIRIVDKAHESYLQR